MIHIRGDSRRSALSLSGPNTVGVTTTLSSGYGYAYNPADWTAAVTSGVGGVTTMQTITHDALGRITALGGGRLSQRWTYDGNGNLLSAISGTATTRYGDTAAITPNEVLTLTATALMR